MTAFAEHKVARKSFRGCGQHVRSLNFISNYEGVGLATIKQRFKDKNQQFNLRDFFYIRDDGKKYLKLRDEIETMENEEP